MQNVGKKNYIIIGFICLIASTLGFAALGFVDNDYIFFGGAILLRFIQGIGGTCL
jgi:MFS family permease